MSVHKSYPDGCAPSAGPFFVRCGPQKNGSIEWSIRADEESHVEIDDIDSVDFCRWLTPKGARELAAALIECADFIDRANMTPEQIAAATAKRC